MMVARAVSCRHCWVRFGSKNLLHKHLQSCLPKAPSPNPLPDWLAEPLAYANFAAGAVKTIESTVSAKPIKAEAPYLVRPYYYLRALIRLNSRFTAELVCWDTGCSVTLTDAAFLQAQLPSHKILQKASPLVVHGIGSNKHTTAEYVNLNIYVPGQHASNDQPVQALLKHMAFIVDDLRAKMLIGMDILASEDIDLEISTSTGYIGGCGTTFELSVTSRPFIKQEVMLETQVSIPAHSHMTVLIKHVTLPAGADFLFKPAKNCPVALFALVVDASFHAVLARNNSDQPIHLSNKL